MKIDKKQPLIFMLPLLGAVAVDEIQAYSQTTRPNIIIILADDMGYGDVSALNPAARTKTPAIDHMTKEGIVFTDAHASASVSTPSRYGLLTGRYAFRSEKAAFGIWGFDRPVIEPGRETLASMLKKMGYTTACIGKWHLGLGWQTKNKSEKVVQSKTTGFSNVDYRKKVTNGPNNHGFDYSFIHPASLDIPPYLFLRDHQVIDPDVILTTDFYPSRRPYTRYAWDKKHTDSLDVYWEKGVWWRRGEMSRSFRIEDCHTTILQEGLAFIEREAGKRGEKPFFLYLPLTGPHTPWVPAVSFRGKSSMGLYGDFIMDIDEAVRRIKEALVRHGIEKNTLLVFTSDNGAYWPSEEIALHHHDANVGRRGQKGDIWEGGHRIPLVITWPEYIRQPKRCNQPISLTDLFSTIGDLAGYSNINHSGEDSYSFLHILKGEVRSSVRPFMIHHSSNNFFAIRQGDWKYIDGLGSGGFTEPSVIQQASGDPAGQLYRLSIDSLETTNRYFEFPEKVKQMKKIMREHVK